MRRSVRTARRRSSSRHLDPNDTPQAADAALRTKMFQSWTFWRLFGAFGLLWLGSVGLMGVVLVARLEQHIAWTLAAAVGLAPLMLAFLMARRTVQPLRELTEAARRIASGEYGRRVDDSGRDEFAALARSFSHASGATWPSSSPRSKKIASSCAPFSAAWSRALWLSTPRSALPSPTNAPPNCLTST